MEHLEDIYEYTAWDVCEYLFGDENGVFKDTLNASDKHQIFDQFVAPMIRCYQGLKNKYEEMANEI